MEKLEDPLREHRGVVGPGKDVRLYGIKEYRSCVLLICRRAYKSESELFDLIVSPQRNPGAAVAGLLTGSLAVRAYAASTSGQAGVSLHTMADAQKPLPKH